MKKAVYYRYGQVLPPRHWYQKSVGWFGKTLSVVMVLSLFGASSYGYILNRASVKRLSAETSNHDRLKKVTDTIQAGGAQNIVDIQYVLDTWAESHPGETWSIAVKSIDGPHFTADLNPDKKYTSSSLQKLLMAVPLYQQVPTEHQKNVQLSVGESKKSMQTCVDLMIRLSDEACASAVAQYLDFAVASGSLKKLGLQHTTFEEQQKAQTSASDITKYLVAIQGGDMGRTAQDVLMRLLREQQHRTGIPAGCPGCQIANKSYPNDTVIHDAAIIKYSGGTYAMTIMTTKGDPSDIGLLTGAVQQKIIDTMTK